MKTTFLFFSLLLFCFCQFSSGDILYLKNGNQMEGKVIEETDELVTIKTSIGEMSFFRSKVERIERKEFLIHKLDNNSISKQSDVPIKKINRVEMKDDPIQTVSVNRLAGTVQKGSYQGLSYHLYVPSGYTENKKFPLLIGIDPSGKGKNHLDLWQNTADLNDYLLMCPSVSGRNWDLKGDVKTLLKMIELIKKGYSVDRNKVYLTGFSLGGMFAFRLAVNYPERFRAVATICSPLDEVPDVAYQNKTISIFSIYGLKDERVTKASRDWAQRKMASEKYPYQSKIIPDMAHESRAENNELVAQFFNNLRR